MPTTPPPRATITIDDLAAIAKKIQPLTRSTNPAHRRRIEAIFNGYGLAFNDTPTSQGDTSCR